MKKLTELKRGYAEMREALSRINKMIVGRWMVEDITAEIKSISYEALRSTDASILVKNKAVSKNKPLTVLEALYIWIAFLSFFLGFFIGYWWAL